MGKLIAFECRKLFRQKSFYVCLAVSVLLIVVTTVSTKMMFGGSDFITVTGTLSSFYSNAMLSILLGVFTALFVSEDAAGGTLKNIYSRGYSRSLVYFAKYIVSSASVLIFCVLDMAVSAIVPLILGGEVGETDSMFIPDLFGTVLLLLCLNTLFFVISILLGKSGTGIALNIIVPNMMTILLPLADMSLNTENFSFSDYWIANALSAAAGAVNAGDLAKSIAIGVVWTAILTVAGVLVNSRQEL